MKTTFTYTVLRYVHDIATGEFVNMGVALYAPEAKYVSAICNPRYGRLSKLFKMPVQKDFVTEQEAAKFSEQLAGEMAKHPVSSYTMDGFIQSPAPSAPIANSSNAGGTRAGFTSPCILPMSGGRPALFARARSRHRSLTGGEMA
jgi:hypothetical protein